MPNRRILFLFQIVVLLLTTATVATAQDEPIRIRLWDIAVDADATHLAFENAVTAFNSSHSDVQVDVTHIPDDAYRTQLQVAIAAGDPPDMFQDWGGEVLKGYIDAGIVREIAALSDEQIRNLFVPAALSPSTFDGKYYSIPVDQSAVFLYYNQALFEQYGLELPNTWSTFLAACTAFSANGIVPAAVGNRDQWPGMFWLDYLILRIGGRDAFSTALYQQDDGARFTDPAFVEAGAKLQEAVNAGCFEQGVNGGTDSDASVLLATGGAAMQLQGNWTLGVLRQIDSEFTDANIRMMLFPIVEGGLGEQAELIGQTGQAIVISTSAPPEAEAALLEMMTSEQFATDLAEAGLIPALAGYDSMLADDPLTLSMVSMMGEATYFQVFSGTALPPNLRVVHWNNIQQLFDLTITPEQAAANLQTAYDELAQAN